MSAYCAYAKDPKEYWRIYEIGYADIFQEKLENYPTEEEPGMRAADFGTCLHRVLEFLDFKDPPRNLVQILADVFRGLEEKYKLEAEKILRGFFQSKVFRSLQAAKKIYREIHFVLNERHGRIDGVIDVLFQDAAGDWHILDYKTAVGDEEKVRKSAYELQIAIYAAAAKEILGIATASAILYFLKNQWEQTLKTEPVFLSSQLERVRGLQQEIIDFRLQMMKTPLAMT